MKEGKIKEKRFIEDFSNNFTVNEVIISTTSEDILGHFDVTLNNLKYDVKSLKRIKRDDPQPNEQYHWLEIKNVHGKKGSLYGDADFLAFETNDFWVVVDIIKVQNFVSKNVNKVYVNNQDEALYCLYRRSERNDVLTLVKTIDLMSIAAHIIPKLEKNRITHFIGDSVYSEKAVKQRISRMTLSSEK